MPTNKNSFLAGAITGFAFGILVAAQFSNSASALVRTCAEAIALIVPKEQGVIAIALLIIPCLCYKVMSRSMRFIKEMQDTTKP